ncbi:MAG TPA: tetratricopeptide repeat protein, partial [Ktedonobacteraceae bacterium]|nr:tetratricopeptide repeat protein [Ktedonobacteraceae bacterium]
KRLSAARRAQLHRRAAQSLIEIHTGNEAEVAAAIVYHLSRYGQEKQPLADYAEIAGNQAMALSAYPEALYHYRQALDALQALQTSSPAGQRDPMHIANLLECIAECDAMQGNFPEARQEYAQVLELHDSQHIDSASFPSQNEFQVWQQEEAQFQAMIWRLIGDTWRYTGDYAQTHACTQRGREVLRSAGITSGVAWAGLEHLDGGIYWAEGNFAEARRHVEISLEIHEQVMRKMQTQEQRDGGAAAKENIRASLQMTRSRRVLLGNPLDLGRARESLGVICASMGLYTEALQHLYAALEIYETHDLVGALSQLCSNIGAVHAVRADYETSRIYLIRALEVTERTGDVPSKVLITGNLGDVAGRTGDLQEAEAWLIKSVALAEQISDRDHISWGLVALSAIQQDLGNLRGALESIRRALVTGRHMKSMVRVGFALIALASWRTTRAIVGYNLEANNYKNLFDIPECPSLLHSAQVAAERALALEGVDSETQCIGQAALANIHLLLGNLDQAQHLALKTLEKTRQNETIYLIGRSQRLLGEIQAARGLEDEADMYFKQALQIFKQYGLRLEYARTLQRYGASLLQRDQQAPADPDNETTSDRGLEYLREAQNIFESCHASIDLQWVERILANPTHPFVRL